MADPGDQELMRLALEEATVASYWGDVPIGAIVARGDEVLSRAGNARERRQDPTAHAEVLALRAASDRLATWRLEGCTMYVTLEPCAMCAGALMLARVDRLVIGAMDEKAGFVGSLSDLLHDPRLNHTLEVRSGVLAGECSAKLREFFRERR